ncbi:MAG: hypothetical protein WKF79_03905 [Nocardioides sp.]
MRLDVVAFGYATAASAFEDANRHAALAYDSLTDKLQGYSAMAGDASIAADFAAAYDDAAAESVGALVDVVTACSTLGRLAQATVDNHRNANRRSVIAGASVYDGSSFDAGYLSVLPTSVPSALGGDPSSLPDWAIWILDQVEGFVWPDADTDRLRKAAATWRDASRQVDHLTPYCDSAIDGLWRELSPEIPVAVAATQDLADTISDLAIQYADLATACDTYADQVEEQREAILDLVSDLLRDAVIIQGIGIVLGTVTAGATAAGAAALNAGKIALAAPRFLRILALLRTLASAAAATIRSAASSVRFLRLRLARFRNVRLAGRSDVGTAARGLRAERLAHLRMAIKDPRRFDPRELRGMSPKQLRELLDDWTRSPSNSGGGVKFADPMNDGRQIRIMPGYPGTRPDPLTHGPYALVSQNGKKHKIPLEGNPTL